MWAKEKKKEAAKKGVVNGTRERERDEVVVKSPPVTINTTVIMYTYHTYLPVHQRKRKMIITPISIQLPHPHHSHSTQTHSEGRDHMMQPT